MPEVKITIGGRDYAVACQEGEEQYLHSAAGLLDTEAAALSGQVSRLPESRMLLMAGLMLADKTAGMEEQLREAEARVAALSAELERARNGAEAAPAAVPEPERIEVEVLPDGLEDALAQLAARAERIASRVDEKKVGAVVGQ
ncbi:cell division protein ZapA [Pseudoruegeria sp. HB172150]|uniref:cell division protein ZapA n=1 Tax=Pseudoruegeria sp. HB172150 TaxID=2721164 RepID=UPI001554A2B7|nr:cell division protein ZapA [Pseudoruegeria sp. HB172150]